MKTFTQTVLDNFKVATDSYDKQLKREIDDLRFQIPELQWDDVSRTQRMGGQGEAMPPRPILSIPKLDQPIQLVLNQEKAAHLGVNIHPLSEDADDDTAEVIQGLYRKIERDSNAGLARSWGFERAVKAGRGAYRVNTRYDEDGGHPFDQKITIERILRQEAVKFDPSAQEADYSDGEWAFVSSWVPLKTFKRLYPKANASGAGALELEEMANATPDWVKFDGEDRAVLVSEYFEKRHRTETIALTADMQVMPLEEVPEGVEVLQKRDRDVVTVWWHKLAPGNGGLEEIEPEQEWNGKYIPLIPVIGRELIPFDGERRWTGVVGPSKDAQRLYNYAASTAVEVASLEPKAPWIGQEGQFEGHEAKWLQSNTRNFPYLEYKPTNAMGQPAPAPTRVQVDTSRLGPSMQLLQQADDFIQSTTFTPDPALGNLNSRDRSGKAIQALQGQSDASTSHYMHSLSQISMMCEARCILDMIPRIYDRAGRVAQILGMDEEPKTVMLNAPHIMGDDGRPQMMQQAPQMPPQQGMPPGMPPGGPQMPPGAQMAPRKAPKTFDLTKGSYGVSVSIGKSWQTRLQQGSDEIGQILQANPALMPLIGPVYFRFRDFPGAKEIADILKKVQDKQMPELADDGDEDVDSLKAKLAAGQQQMQQMGQQMQAMQQDLAIDKAKQEAMLQKAQIEAQVKMQLAQMDVQGEGQKIQAQTAADDRRVQVEAQVEAALEEKKLQMEQALERMQAQFEMAKLAQEQRFEALQAELDRQHEMRMAQMAAQQADRMADKAAESKEKEGDD